MNNKQKFNKEDMCPAKLDKKVGDCYYNQVNGEKHQRKKGEPLCSHCYNSSFLIKNKND